MNLLESSKIDLARKLLDQGLSLRDVAQELQIPESLLAAQVKMDEGDEEVSAEEAKAAKDAILNLMQSSRNEQIILKAATQLMNERPWSRKLRKTKGDGQVIVNIEQINSLILQAETKIKEDEAKCLT